MGKRQKRSRAAPVKGKQERLCSKTEVITELMKVFFDTFVQPDQSGDRNVLEFYVETNQEYKTIVIGQGRKRITLTLKQVRSLIKILSHQIRLLSGM